MHFSNLVIVKSDSGLASQQAEIFLTRGFLLSDSLFVNLNLYARIYSLAHAAVPEMLSLHARVYM